jgi:nitronate monooxygenase
VPVISFFSGHPESLVERAKKAGRIVMQTVGSAAEALRAVDNGVDVVVAQGWEAGGHVRGTVATMVLVPAVVDAVGDVPVVAAGGVADDRGLAAALALGASGAWMGTRFLAAEESTIHPTYQGHLLDATETDTVWLEDLFDVGWPNAPHRVLRNTTVANWGAAGRPASGHRPGEGEVIASSPTRGDIVRYQSFTSRADTIGDIEAVPMWAGQTVGMVRKREPASVMLSEIVEDTRAILKRLGR